MIFAEPIEAPSRLRAAIPAAWLADETPLVKQLIEQAGWKDDQQRRIEHRASRLIMATRSRSREHTGLDAFLSEYDLSSQEGVVLMCLAEALLRIPDSATADRLIRDKLAHADWERHLGKAPSLLVNAGTWGLMLTGRVLRCEELAFDTVGGFLGKLASRSGEPMIRAAMKEAMLILAHQFVMGRNLDEALKRSHGKDNAGLRFSYDMLGEAALTTADAERYHEAYSAAIAMLAECVDGVSDVISAPGISIKLSALHPRFELAQRHRVMRELLPRVIMLARQARAAGIGLTLDAEESWRLEPTLDVFAALFNEPSLQDWNGLGIAVQAYQKRALPVIEWLASLVQKPSRRIMLRLVKGAYWDSEIKLAQQQGLAGYPVFTRKQATDVSYLACVRRIFALAESFYPQFATHNAHTIAAVLELSDLNPDFEFQRLHGMGEVLYAQLAEQGITVPCRVYAPVGSHEQLLPYLVRRLLENGANTSFVNRLGHERMAVGELVRDPVEMLRNTEPIPHPGIPLPRNLYAGERLNASGVNLESPSELMALAEAMNAYRPASLTAMPLVGGERRQGAGERNIHAPSDQHRLVGRVSTATQADVDEALRLAHRAAADWAARPPEQRATVLERMADLLERHRAELMALIIAEGGRCLADALAEVREAVDYCRYYAAQGRKDFAVQRLPGPSGEHNELTLHGRGVFVSISPWNFPLAIFVGQITAALMAGNSVIAKPASQTPLTGFRAVELLHRAGAPPNVLHFIPGSGAQIGGWLLSDPRIAGVVFTGSTATAAQINRTLAARDGPIIPFIAETGGQNAMLVDSSALPEQFVMDVLRSAFNSAGQRCSALRVLFVQDDIAVRTLALLQGAMVQLSIGDPFLLSTDVGPVIDAAARQTLRAHCQRMRAEAVSYFELSLPASGGSEVTAGGLYVAPAIYRINHLGQLPREVFGPILHVITYPSAGLDDVITQINHSGYGLTLGIHSRIGATIDHIRQEVNVGNVYVNRDMIGAVVGVQPFGGTGLSGTGPKAGGPHYLIRFAMERSYTENTAAMGGNVGLLAME